MCIISGLSLAKAITKRIMQANLRLERRIFLIFPAVGKAISAFLVWKCGFSSVFAKKNGDLSRNIWISFSPWVHISGGIISSTVSYTHFPQGFPQGVFPRFPRVSPGFPRLCTCPLGGFPQGEGWRLVDIRIILHAGEAGGCVPGKKGPPDPGRDPAA